MAMKLGYSSISFDDLRGDTVADYVIAVEADFEVSDEGRVIYAEPSFPFVELVTALIDFPRICSPNFPTLLRPGFGGVNRLDAFWAA